jgi:hypothetical protein
MNTRINIKAFSLAVMLFYAIIIFIFSIWHAATGFGREFIKVFESIHPKFATINYLDTIPTLKSILTNIPAVLINVVWALIDGLIIGVLISTFYNWILKLDSKEKSKKSKK